MGMKMQRREEEEKEDDEEEGKTVVVGIRLDAESREILTWALVKVALPGDHVIALHVLPSAAAAEANQGDKSAAFIDLAAAFHSMLAVYDGFCHLKQIDMKLKICHGSSIWKTLVREATGFSAATLILGVNKSPRTIGSSSTSIAKQCTKKLPKNCSVFAVNNGKIVFQREVAESKRTVCSRPASLASSKSFSKPDDSDSSQVAIHVRGESISSAPSSSPYYSVSEHGSSCESIDVDSISVSTNDSQNQSCPICEPNSVSNGESAPVASLEDRGIQELQEGKPGWPLIRRALLNDRKSNSEWPKVSVVQWAMRLPSRYSASSLAHHDHKLVKSNSNTKYSSDIDSTNEDPVGTNLVHSYNKEAERLMELESLREKYSSVCRIFGYKELVDATSNFLPENLIGKGGNSKVYRGCLPDGKELAVKILKTSEDDIKEFVSEIEIITTLHHKNIISLFGFCFGNNSLILLYDFLSRGSLEENLHGEEERKSLLTWVERFKVALGVAEALDYLHGGGSAESVIHRDVKSSNILLSNNFEPKLSDFGFSTKTSSSASHITCSNLAGTFGYLAPEYFIYGTVDEKIDVYAFGVVLLELLSGRKPIITGCPKGEESLVMWAKQILKGRKVKELVDPSLGKEYNSVQMERMVLAASLCIRQAPQCRPRVATVLKLLQGDDEVVRWARSQVNSSEGYEGLDDEAQFLNSDIQSYLNLALLDVENDSLSFSSTENTVDFITANSSSGEYLQGRWSRTSSFD